LCSIFELFDVQNIMTLKPRLGVIEGHTNSYSSSVVTMAVSCTVFKIKRDRRIGLLVEKHQFLRLPFYVACTIPKKLLEFLPKILIQTVQELELLGGAKILPKSSSLPRVQQCYRRQTEDRRKAHAISRK